MTADSTLPPVEPAAPALEECCGSGCDPCVFDVYEQRLARFREALAIWRVAQRDTSSEAASGDGAHKG